MCIILFSYRTHPKYKLILASNRDEFYSRPTEPLGYWPENKNILAGRDMQNGGTWMGVTKNGRFAALTNFRNPSTIKDNAPSRGLLVSNFLEGNENPENYLEKLEKSASLYNDFNLLVGDTDNLLYFSNVSSQITKIAPGIHGLSNHLLNTPWPKVKKGKKALEKHTKEIEIDTEAILNFLWDTSPPPDKDLPDTGVGMEWERALSPIFIKTKHYGTRTSSVLLIHNEGHVTFIEKSINYDNKDDIMDKIITIDF